jgi:hypothetical protein
MMNRCKIVGVAALVSLFALSMAARATNAQDTTPVAKKKTTQSKKQPAPPMPDLEPKALELLKASSDRLAAAHTMSFTAVEIFEHPSRHGHPLAYSTRSEVTLQRPDRLRVLISGDGPASEFYYDGKVMMAYAPAENLVAVANAPRTIDATLEEAYHSAGIYFPFTDVMVANPYKDMAEGLRLAYYIGQSHVVGGTTTDMVAYIDNGVFVQMWIGTEDKLPRLLHAVFLDDPEHLRHELQLSNWQLEAAVPPESFAAANASSAKRIQFAHPHPQPRPGAKPAAEAKALKAQQ